MKLNNWLFIASFAIFHSAYGLVDYSDQASEGAAPQREKAASGKRAAPTSSNGQASAFQSELRFGYESLEADTTTGQARANFYRLGARLQTPYSLYIDVSGAMASTRSAELSDSRKEQVVNPEMVIGLNWLQFAGATGPASIDLTVGHRFGLDSGDFAATHSDYIFGVETKKRIHNFALGLGYQYTLTGDNKNSDDLQIGNVHHLFGEFGYQATMDIVFSLAAGHYTFNTPSDQSDNALQEKMTSSYFSPKLSLLLSPGFTLELGAIFQGKRVADANLLVNEKLHAYKALYGDSLFAHGILSF